MQSLSQLIAFAIWIGGIILSSGFWSCFFTVIFPPWGWYLVIEHFFF